MGPGLIIIYVVALAVVAMATILLRAAFGDKWKLVFAVLTPFVFAGVILLAFRSTEVHGSPTLLRAWATMTALLLPGSIYGVWVRRGRGNQGKV